MIIGSRSLDKGLEAVRELQALPITGTVEAVQLDGKLPRRLSSLPTSSTNQMIGSHISYVDKLTSSQSRTTPQSMPQLLTSKRGMAG